VFKFKVKRFFRKCLIAVILVAVVYGIFMAGKFVNPIVKYQIQEKEVILDNLSEKINELKGKLVDDIRKCESAGYSEDDGIIIFDSNNKASIGNYQFQKKTVIYYAKMFYGKDLTGKEAVLLALDEKKAGELASKVIFESENGLDNWLNCSKKVGAYAQLKVIKELEK
jgi:hypothetical protein